MARQDSERVWLFPPVVLWVLVAALPIEGRPVPAITRDLAFSEFTQSRTKESSQYRALIAKLRKKGAKVGRTREKVTQPFLAASGHVLTVNEHFVQVFEYKQVSAAIKDANRVSPDGMTIGTTKMMWLGTSHFFRDGKLILLFLGDDPESLKILRAAIGDQFAGG